MESKPMQDSKITKSAIGAFVKGRIKENPSMFRQVAEMKSFPSDINKFYEGELTPSKTNDDRSQDGMEQGS